MKKLLTILFVFLSASTIAQTTVVYNKLRNDGNSWGGKDTVVKYALANTVNKYFTGYGTWGSLPDTVRTYFSVDTSGTSGGATYNPSTGVFHIPVISGGGGGSSTVQKDSSLLIATTHGSYITNPFSGRKGLLLRDTTTTLSQSSPAITWQGGNPSGGKMFWRGYIVGVNRGLSFDYSTDTTTWTNALILNYTGGISTGGVTTTGVGQFLTTNGNLWYLDSRGFASFGVSYPSNSSAWDFRPYGSDRYGIGLPNLSLTNRNNYPSTLVTGSIISGGTGYTNGTYLNKSFTNINSNGVGAIANFVVSGGAITTVSSIAGGTGGYKVGDTISVAAASVGGTGSGFTFLITSILGDARPGNLYYDSSLSKVVYYDAHAHVNRPVVDSVTISGNLTVSSASTLTLVAGNDYSFTGTTATYTLPAISSTAIGRQNRIYIKNRGSGTITLNAASGSTIYTTSAVATINIIAGAACELTPDGTYFLVNYNQ